MKKTVTALVILMAGLLAWGLLESGSVSVTVNGLGLAGPVKAAAGVWGVLVAAVAIFCVSVLLAFVLAGVALVVLGVLVLVGLILAAVAFPFLLPLLLPLFIVWAFVAGVRRGKKP